MSCCFAHRTFCVLDVAVAVVVSQGPYNWKREIFISVFENTRSRSERTGRYSNHFRPSTRKRLWTLTISIPVEHAPYNVWHHSFREPPFASVHTKTVSWRFQKLGTVLENLRFIAPENALYLCQRLAVKMATFFVALVIHQFYKHFRLSVEETLWKKGQQKKEQNMSFS